MTNLHAPRFDIEGDQSGFRYRRARLGYQAGCERLGVSLWELPPGEATPYGYHYGNEELLIVLAGRPSTRTPRVRCSRRLARSENQRSSWSWKSRWLANAQPGSKLVSK